MSVIAQSDSATTDLIGVADAAAEVREQKLPRLLSIRSYTIVFCCLIVVVAIVIFAASMLNYMSSLTYEELRERARLQASAIEASISKDLQLDQLTEVRELSVSALANSSDLSYIVVTEKKHGSATIILPGGRWSWEADSSLWRELEAVKGGSTMIASPMGEGEVMHYVYPVRSLGIESPGWVHIGMSPRSYHEHMNRFKTRTIAMALAALAFGLPASLLFGRMLTRPITQLQAFAERVAEGDLDSRVVAGGTKEISNLATTMNWMTQKLAESRATMKDSMVKEASLREKEILLREIHHRVKNNMQILGGLIRIQCRSLESGEARDVLIESETRIRSMALLHQKLYQSDSISEIAFGDYVEVLVGELRRIYEIPGLQVIIDIPKDFEVGLDTALPCGLIINELVSNCFKYAFPDGQGGKLKIQILPGEQGRFEMIVSDNGVGLPDDFDLDTAKSLGLRLVNMLVEQLEGEVFSESRDGSIFTMKLVSSKYVDRT